MGTSIVFFSSFGAIAVLLALKVVELKSGLKPLSEWRHKFDAFLREKTDIVLHFARFFNSQTAKLIVFFLLSELKDGVVYLARKVRESYLGDMVRGRNIPTVTTLQSSAYLQEIGAVKVQAREATK